MWFNTVGGGLDKGLRPIVSTVMTKSEPILHSNWSFGVRLRVNRVSLVGPTKTCVYLPQFSHMKRRASIPENKSSLKGKKFQVDTEPGFKVYFTVNKSNRSPVHRASLVHYKWVAPGNAPQYYITPFLQQPTPTHWEPDHIHCRTTLALLSLDRNPFNHVIDRSLALNILRESLFAGIAEMEQEDNEWREMLFRRYNDDDDERFAEKMGYVVAYPDLIDADPVPHLECVYYDATVRIVKAMRETSSLSSSDPGETIESSSVISADLEETSGSSSLSSSDPVDSDETTVSDDNDEAIERKVVVVVNTTEELVTKKCYEIMAEVFENAAALLRERIQDI